MKKEAIRNVISPNSLRKSYKKVIHTAPITLYWMITLDFMEMGLLKRLNKQNFFLLKENCSIKKKLKRLEEKTFFV